MLNPVILFSNLFRSHTIKANRLYSFGVFVLQALTAANSNAQFDPIIAILSAALAALKQELKDIDTGISEQKTETRTVDEFIVSFYTYMSDNEPFIARQLGGRKSAGYALLYPFGLSEYSNATKTNMPTLTGRTNTVAKKYTAQLDADIVQQLTSFEPDFEKYYGSQQQQIQTVKKDKAGKKTAAVQLQLALTMSVFAVAYQYPANVQVCSAFFPFQMLYPKGQRKRYLLKGSIDKMQTMQLLNYVLNKTALIVCANKSVNASIALWITGQPLDPMPGDAFIITSTDSVLTIDVSTLGDLTKKPFVMMKNLSDVNACTYEVTFIGLKKAIPGAVLIEDDSNKKMEMIENIS